MSRIIAGSFKGRRLASVPHDGTRPTSDRVKESLFSRLEGYDAIVDAVVVDLFAGSGALGLEALSRGARSAELVDKGEAAVRTMKRNAAQVGVVDGSPPQATVTKADAAKYLRARSGPPIELLFLDPPYAFSAKELTQVLASAGEQLHPAATVVVERDARSGEPEWPAGLELFHDRSYGTTHVWLAEPE
ncbi:MAG TPA: 16S rRNA (guanine(966)-N(2))-methyltransferase RsmD [Candidatus Nesterenkonia stercoripullorum]|uniref:16S rRNA (Guanine(966)-N(2))-methyltransferase RsmD n=1 Tax=Candidatus Nesterenkonia stercoripullorum TaxID=2838701 RepID=A0A9D1URN4_9MICC|nr:16S rRNA (guanine(966)-N(2))-methyltransferase RsmD [Candidatus Nesterenkonia stercoripullorum]